VIETVLNAQTVPYTLVVGEEGEGSVVHDMVIGSGIRRTDTVSNIPYASIIDIELKCFTYYLLCKAAIVSKNLRDFPKTRKISLTFSASLSSCNIIIK